MGGAGRLVHNLYAQKELGGMATPLWHGRLATKSWLCHRYLSLMAPVGVTIDGWDGLDEVRAPGGRWAR
jgi:hypothetical protein